MTTRSIQWIDDTGKTLYWFPDASLSTWTTNRVPATERGAPDLGIYDASLDDAISNDWYLFEGASQPASWNASISSLQLEIPSSNSRPVNWVDATGKTLYWFPDGNLDDWATLRVAATERSSPDLGMYDATLDRTLSTDWYLFEGAAQPASWSESITTLELLASTSETPASIPPLGGISYTELKERVGHYLFGIREGFSYDQTRDIDDCIHDGLNRVYSAREWSFFRPVADVTTTTPYATGTVTIASGVVTLTGGTFPSWAASGILYVNNSYYSINTRDSNTQITLDDTTVTLASASSYQLGRPEIAMSAAFDAVANDSDLTYYPSPDCWYPPVRWRHDSTIRKLEAGNPEFDRPAFYSVRTSTFDPSVGSRRVLALYPAPDAAYTLRVPMILRPVELNNANPYPIGGEMLRQVILEACLAAAEHNFEEREHVHEKRFMEQIALAIRNDEDRSSPTSLGPDSPRGAGSKFGVADYEHRMREQRIGTLTLGGDVM